MLHRRVTRWLLFGSISLLMISNIFHLLSFLDRQSIRKDAIMQRRMLNARAHNQRIYFEALARKGLLTPAEQEEIIGNWTIAEYDK